ncbi:N-acetylmuramoyl-L-alanine amidase/peptidoglycan hydrolase-like protein with peptidoglycan-binding domain [Virgibacillus halotolerans]|uniref:N-acetylmuramoyl-L-alanine amidase n=1 Tax=Virgibacillus halotolerans TaxID=1071053 RepID=UPI0019613F35|nr:N-acetylmuramoyl-L-alanine amidase [Virgibacillus halotolerans]MBM7598065.1 N-acetylmuramoyl-L-alanine amidase/peptidoglycan hydrolase-like protein with peptidoglycan-binding domain [Virgibacillus halotolerans]
MVKTVAVDIGHGSNTFPPSKGVYNGGKGYAEHSFNAKLGMRIKDILEANGVKVILGQQPNKADVPLTTRTNLYNRENVDVVFSVHANAGGGTGRCAFYWGTSNESKKLAETVVKHIKAKGYSTHGNGLHAGERGSWTNLHINRETNMPAVLVEHGFMDTASDFELIFGGKQSQYIEDMAQADAQAVMDYLGVKGGAKVPNKTSKPNKTQTGSSTTTKPKVTWIKVTGSWNGTPTLRNGQYGNPVKQLQDKLKAKGYLTAKQVDSYFGSTSETAVRNAQKDAGITNDGLAGKGTYKALSGSAGNLKIDGIWGNGTTRQLQKVLKTTADGVISNQPNNAVTKQIIGVTFGNGSSPMVKKLQKKVGSAQDGRLGANTIKQLQKHLGTVQDGKLSNPSLVVKELQRRLNKGTF